MKDEIKYYEDELNNHHFVERMIEHLNDPENTTSPYKDIDSEDDDECVCPEYYNDLKSFLRGVLGDCIIYEPNNPEGDKCKISMFLKKNENETKILLTSDTFGFSAKDDAIINNQNSGYPYGKIYDRENEEICSFISKSIRETRTLGGAFLWPVDMRWTDGKWTGNRKSFVNFKRGVGRSSYIEDRVDVTLWLIKKFYEIFRNHQENESEKKESVKSEYSEKGYVVLLKNNDWDVVYDWLEIFGTFENYVDSLCFSPFVVKQIVNGEKEYWPIDMLQSNEFETIILNNFPTKKEIKEIKPEDNEKIITMIKNVRERIIKRTKLMEKVVKRNQPS